MNENSVTTSNAALFVRMIRGDDPAFSELYRLFAGKLERYIRRQLGADAPVEDLHQELWERVINLRRKPPRDLEAGEFQVQAFLFRIAHNLVIDHVRTRKNHTDLLEAEEVARPVREVPDAEDLVARAMEALPFDFREVLVLNLHLGYRFDEIAAMLDKSPDAIWARASRARAKLRTIVVELAEKEGISLEGYLASSRGKKKL